MKHNQFFQFSLLLLFLVLSITVYSQKDSLPFTNTNFQVRLDTLKIQSIELGNIKKWYENSAMPWIASLIIAFLTVIINIIISRSTRKTSVRLVERQIESSIRTAGLQFNSTLNSNNRQEWINEVRHCTSELATQCQLLNGEFQEEIQSRENKMVLYEKVIFNRNKLLLLLNASIETHNNFLKSISALVMILDIHLLNSQNRIRDFDNIAFFRKIRRSY
ncbi:MAG: hypothetical protein IPL54_16910 [Chitinophagaceae bacterium]|nr:hypothetical protein [Chitinophagaceae bacterium]